MSCQYCLNVRNLHACGTLADIKVLVTTEGFMSEVRSRSAPARQMSGLPTAAGTDTRNSLIFIKSKTRLRLTSLHLLQLACPRSRHHCVQDSDGNSTKCFQSQHTHPSTAQVLSRGESTPHVSALVQCTLKMALKPEGYITLLM